MKTVHLELWLERIERGTRTGECRGRLSVDVDGQHFVYRAIAPVSEVQTLLWAKVMAGVDRLKKPMSRVINDRDYTVTMRVHDEFAHIRVPRRPLGKKFPLR